MTVIVEPPSAQINRKSRKNVEMVVAYRNIRKKVDCVEAQRIMYILNQLQRRLLLLGKHLIIMKHLTLIRESWIKSQTPDRHRARFPGKIQSAERIIFTCLCALEFLRKSRQVTAPKIGILVLIGIFSLVPAYAI